MRMKSEIKAKWIGALESGDFPKGKGHLLSGGKYCCLGVLCELAEEEGIVQKRDVSRDYGHKKGDIGFQATDNPSDSSPSYLPFAVKEWAGLIENEQTNPQVALARINDFEETFEPVIEYIKENL